MKTTVDIEDALLIAAKKRAVELRRPLRRLIEDGLRAQLRSRPSSAAPRKIKWVTVRGGLPNDVDWNNREAMHDWLNRNP